MNNALIAMKPGCRPITQTAVPLARGRVHRRQAAGFRSRAIPAAPRPAPAVVAPVRRRPGRVVPSAWLALGAGLLAWVGAIAWVGARLADPMIATAVVSYVGLPFLVFFKPDADRRRYRR